MGWIEAVVIGVLGVCLVTLSVAFVYGIRAARDPRVTKRTYWPFKLDEALGSEGNDQ